MGDQFALLEAIVALAVFLQNMDFELVADQKINMTTGATIHTTDVSGLFASFCISFIFNTARLQIYSKLTGNYYTVEQFIREPLWVQEQFIYLTDKGGHLPFM